jgi:hypothetical protein
VRPLKKLMGIMVKRDLPLPIVKMEGMNWTGRVDADTG